MTERVVESNWEGTYIVTLPEGDIGERVYGSIPLIGKVDSDSEGRAVRDYIRMNVANEAVSRRVVRALEEQVGSLDKYATIVPEVDFVRQRVDAFAWEIAAKRGQTLPGEADYDRAHYLLRKTSIA